jgi:hypothetical protein
MKGVILNDVRKFLCCLPLKVGVFLSIIVYLILFFVTCIDACFFMATGKEILDPNHAEEIEFDFVPERAILGSYFLLNALISLTRVYTGF